jgi:hypothetical protein
MSVEDDLITDVGIDSEDDDTTHKLSAKEVSQQTLEMRRKIEDKLERRRLKDQLGYGDISDLDF